jgi:hypothetical protein
VTAFYYIALLAIGFGAILCVAWATREWFGD